MTILTRIFLLTALFSASIYAQHHHETPAESAPEKSEKTELVDEFAQLSHCDLTARFDNLFAQVSDREGSVGYVIVYLPVNALPGDYDEPPMRRMFLNHMAFRNFDSSRIVVINGGFQPEDRTELWIVAPGGEVPAPRNTVTPPAIPTNKTFLFDRSSIAFDDSGELLKEFELPSVKAAREADEAEAAAEMEAEATGEEDGRAADSEPVPSGADEPTEPEEPYVDTRTPEEIEDEKFEWVSEKFGRVLAQRRDSTGVIILYADDQTLDIQRLTNFVEQGKARIAKAAGLDAARLTVRFGGYRDFPAVDYWIVPAKGQAPVATPDERPKEEPEPTETANGDPTEPRS